MKIRKWQPRVEALESRWVPALLLQLDGAGNLTGIFGTPDGDVDLIATASDEINVVEDGNDLGTYSVPGNLRASLGNVVAAIVVTLDLGGNDLSGNIAITTGSSLGGYTVAATSGTIGGNLSVRTGNGDDTITTTDLTVNGSASLNGGGGTDAGTVDATTVEGNLTVTSIETFALVGSAVLGHFTYASLGGVDATLSLAADSSIEGNAVVRTGGGDDQMSVNATILGSAMLQTGAGDDDISNIVGDAFNVLGNLIVNTGAGADRLFVDGDVAGNVTATFGAGDDQAFLGEDSATTILGSAVTLVMGNGDDSFTAGANAVTAPGARLTFLGGNGDDTVDWSTSIPVFLSAYLDGGFGLNTADLTGGTIDFPFTLRNFA